MNGDLERDPWGRLSRWVGEHLGLRFAPEDPRDLRRGFLEAAAEFGFADPARCLDWLLAQPPNPNRLQVLASHLTIGETYFFRERRTLEALADRLRLRAAVLGSRRLRIWSAGCCTGEEPYSLAILLSQQLPDWERWDIRILGTDVNPRFLAKAEQGVFGPWSFRNEPPGFKERYFTRTADGRFAILPDFKRRVTIAYLNLAQEPHGSVLEAAGGMDLILCRNVLMYFTEAQARKAVAAFHRILADRGWLAVSPSEASGSLCPPFRLVALPGVSLFQKRSGPDQDPDPAPAWTPATMPVCPDPPLALDLGGPAAPEPAPPAPPDPPGPKDRLALQARHWADQGALEEALACCDQWVAASKLDPAAHYLRAAVLAERGDAGQARAELRHAIYLDPDFAMARFALGQLARQTGQRREACKHFATALRLLQARPAAEPVPEGAGLNAGSLVQCIVAMLGPGPSGATPAVIPPGPAGPATQEMRSAMP